MEQSCRYFVERIAARRAAAMGRGNEKYDDDL